MLVDGPCGVCDKYNLFDYMYEHVHVHAYQLFYDRLIFGHLYLFKP